MISIIALSKLTSKKCFQSHNKSNIYRYLYHNNNNRRAVSTSLPSLSLLSIQKQQHKQHQREQQEGLRLQQHLLLPPQIFRKGGTSSSHFSKKYYTSTSKMSFHFGSAEYTSTFRDIPKPDVEAIRKSTLEYLDMFDPKLWYDDPITSLVNGKKLVGSEDHKIETKDAFGVSNGYQYNATKEQISNDIMKNHIMHYTSKYTDLREECRDIEHQLLTKYAGELIGNQCIDFGKQDGVTEIEEASMANIIEQRLNDLLLRDEQGGETRIPKIKINRQPIYICCVSNFTNFLDLFRKTIRSIEVGIPCIVLSRSNTAQHSYRWTQLLVRLLHEKNIDPGMISYLSCTLSDIQTITQSCQDYTGNLYTTCSRKLAQEIKSGYPNTISSTGGPNTLIVSNGISGGRGGANLTKEVMDAIHMSSTIESSGQCTALRHCVLPSGTSTKQIEQIFEHVKDISSSSAGSSGNESSSSTGISSSTAPDALKNGIFDGVNKNHEGSSGPATNSDGHDKYTYISDADVYYKVDNNADDNADNNNIALPPTNINEYWRKVVVDFTRMDINSKNDEAIKKLSKWLNATQPISLAINAPRDNNEQLHLAIKLFDHTGMVVYTVGNNNVLPDVSKSGDPELCQSGGHDALDQYGKSGSPALTCQARPQECEIFGEFPPRGSIAKYTKFPVVVPSSTPSYDSSYTEEYLLQMNNMDTEYNFSKSASNLLDCITDKKIKGYCHILVSYLQNATKINPKSNLMITEASRTAVWGLQKPPLDTVTFLHCSSNASWDYVIPIYIIYFATTARDSITLSVDPNNKDIINLCEKHKLKHIIQSDEEYKRKMEKWNNNNNDDSEQVIFNMINTDDETRSMINTFPMVGNFTSLYLPLGHIKSTEPNDEKFVLMFESLSNKWIETLF